MCDLLNKGGRPDVKIFVILVLRSPQPVWPNIEIKSSPILFLMLPKKNQGCFNFCKKSMAKWPKRSPIFWLLLQENWLSRSFKNRPIWSHWPRRKSARTGVRKCPSNVGWRRLHYFCRSKLFSIFVSRKIRNVTIWPISQNAQFHL